MSSLKIDRSFVAEIVSDKTDLKIADNIVKLAHDLNLHVVAEGVETIEQLDIIRKMGCDQLQGYFLGVPTKIEKFADLLTEAKCNPKLQTAPASPITFVPTDLKKNGA